MADHLEALAAHYSLAENNEKAAHFSGLAARKAWKATSVVRAISFAEQSVACLEKMPMTEEVQRKLIDARTLLGLYFVQMNQKKAKDAIDPIVEPALKLNYKAKLPQIYMILGTYHSTVTENLPEACRTLEYALKMAEETNDLVSLVLAGYYYASSLAAVGQFEKSEEHFQKSYEINLAAGSLWGASTMLSTCSWGCLLPQGKVEEGFRATEKSIELAEKSGDVYSRGTAYASHGISCFFKGFFQEAEIQMEKGFQWRSAIPFAWYGIAQIFLGFAYAEMGNFEKSKDSLYLAISALADNDLQPSLVTLGRAALTRTKILNSERDFDGDFLRDIRCNFLTITGFLYWCLGDIYLHIDDDHIPEAEYWYRQAMETSEQKSTKFSGGLAAASYAELFRRKGDHTQAKSNLGRAIDIFRECGADGWVAKYEKELARL